MAHPEDTGTQEFCDEVSGKDDHPLAALVGGVRGALESILPPAAFIIAYVATGDSVAWASGIAIIIAAAFAIWRIAEGKRPTRSVGALFIVAISAYLAVKTGSAAAFFWPRVLINVVSGMAFVFSIAIRWPLLGVIVGPLVGTRMRWRQDPDLVRAYGRASWLWVALCMVRAAILIPLIEEEALLPLALTGALFYALVIATVMLSWVAIKRSLPPGHPGVRHPRVQPA